MGATKRIWEDQQWGDDEWESPKRMSDTDEPEWTDVDNELWAWSQSAWIVDEDDDIYYDDEYVGDDIEH
jgi:hypothetical protein